jgi:hypothetical protein
MKVEAVKQYLPFTVQDGAFFYLLMPQETKLILVGETH